MTTIISVDVGDCFCCRVSGQDQEEANDKAAEQFSRRFPDANVMNWRCTPDGGVDHELWFVVEIDFIDCVTLAGEEDELIQDANEYLNTQYSSPFCLSERFVTS